MLTGLAGPTYPEAIGVVQPVLTSAPLFIRKDRSSAELRSLDVPCESQWMTFLRAPDLQTMSLHV